MILGIGGRHYARQHRHPTAVSGTARSLRPMSVCSRVPPLRTRRRSRYPPGQQSDYDFWNNDPPGGRKLWCRLVFAFTSVCFFGVGLVTLGAVFIGQSHQMHNEGGTSLPLTWCIIGIVSGSLLVVGSILLGRVMVSPKWRKNEQPTYPSAAPRPPQPVRYIREDSSVDTDMELPPPYSGPPGMPYVYDMTQAMPIVLTIPGRNIALTIPPPLQSTIRLPGYSDVAGPIPQYDDIDKPEGGNNLQGVTGGGDVGGGAGGAGGSSGTCSGRIKVITVVSTSRGDPPPYEETTSSSTYTEGSMVSEFERQVPSTANDTSTTEGNDNTVGR